MRKFFCCFFAAVCLMGEKFILSSLTFKRRLCANDEKIWKTNSQGGSMKNYMPTRYHVSDEIQFINKKKIYILKAT